MKVLIIGGRGNISWHCTEFISSKGHEVFVLNRNLTINTRKVFTSSNIQQLTADINDKKYIENIVTAYRFDVVIDFLCYTPEQAKENIKLFSDKVKQYIFISSAANYDRRSLRRPITEDVNLYNPDWSYSDNKIKCEEVFINAYKNAGFPVTIVRPGHTYDTLLPEAVGNGCFTNAKRIIDKKPIIIHGDGTTLWTLTHSYDLARALYGTLLNMSTIGEAYHITSDEWYTWNEIMHIVSKSLGNDNPKFIYVPSKKILEEDFSLGIGIVCHKMYCDVYDNSKIKEICKGWKAEVSIEDGINSTIKWLAENKQRQRVNENLDMLIDTLCLKYGS